MTSGEHTEITDSMEHRGTWWDPTYRLGLMRYSSTREGTWSDVGFTLSDSRALIDEELERPGLEAKGYLFYTTDQITSSVVREMEFWETEEAKFAQEERAYQEAMSANTEKRMAFQANVVRDVLSSHGVQFGEQIRTKQSTGVSEQVRAWSEYYPASWVRQVNEIAGKLDVTKIEGRASYNMVSHEVRVRGNASDIMHELGHSMEHNQVNNLTPTLRSFWTERTEASTVTTMQKLRQGAGYSALEGTKPDDFAEPYMGKWYPVQSRDRSVYEQYDGRRERTSEAYEVLSQGLEYVYGVSGTFGEHKAPHNPKDPFTDKLSPNEWFIDSDHAAFLFGVLSDPQIGAPYE